MNFRILKSFLLIVLVMLHLNGCYATKVFSETELHFGGRDKIISYTEKNSAGEKIPVKSDTQRFAGAYVYKDSLFIKVEVGRFKNTQQVQYTIPLSALQSVEIKIYDKKATFRLVGGIAGGLLGLLIVASLVGMIYFAIILSQL